MPRDPTDILDLARSFGFAVAGVADARPSDRAAEVRAWVAQGKHGSMDWFTEHLEVRLHPARLMTGTRCAICVADRYASSSSDVHHDVWPPRGRIARYARGEDYHQVMRKRLRKFVARLRELFPQDRFRFAIDLLPILERELAERAGIGQVGKHTLIIRRGEGSYLLLGEILTTLDLATTPTAAGASDPCGSCTRCIDACPTQAITPYSVDASRCLAYTTIEHRGPIDAELRAKTDDWLFGCDICQEVCPHNEPTRRKRRLAPFSAYAARAESMDLLAILGWTEQDRLAATLRSALRRAQLDMLKRNALVCLGNALATRRDEAIVHRIRGIAGDAAESELVRTTAIAVLAPLEEAHRGLNV